ncbi:MAG: MlaD family protein [Bacteroidetes bacterium]|jgi:phospholipid/cholesterol/gamma-HCH transport system substrate-binding protein|nr:MlaD family protein [Bacteroidota bacterium]
MVKITKEAKVAILVVVAGAMLIFGLSYLNGRSVLGTNHTFYVYFPSADGLNRGDKVSLRGVDVGTVRAREIVGDGQDAVRIELEIQSQIKVPSDSYLLLTETSPVFGQKLLELHPGTSGQLLEDGATIRDSVGTGLADKLGRTVNPTLDRINNLSDNLIEMTGLINKIMRREDARANVSIQNLEQTLANIAFISNQLKGTVASIQRLSDNANQNFIDHPDFKKMLGNTRQATDSLAATLAEVRGLATETTRLAQDLKQITHNLKQGDGTLGKLLYDEALYANLTATTASLNALLQDMTKHPKRYVHFSVFGRRDKDKKDKEQK